MRDARHRSPGPADWEPVCLRRGQKATAGGAGRFEKPAPDARAAPPEAHELLIGRKTVEEVPLTKAYPSLGDAQAISPTRSVAIPER